MDNETTEPLKEVSEEKQEEKTETPKELPKKSEISDFEKHIIHSENEDEPDITEYDEVLDIEW